MLVDGSSSEKIGLILCVCCLVYRCELYTFPLGFLTHLLSVSMCFREKRTALPNLRMKNEYLMHNQFYIPNSSLILPYTSHSISGLLSPSHPCCLFFSPRVLIKHLFIEQWTGTSPDCPTLSRSVSISPLTPFSQSVNLNLFPVSLLLCSLNS